MPKTGYSSKRRPFAKKVPRAGKASLGRTSAAETPLSIRTSGISTSPELNDYVRERIGLKLGKFAPRIERATVRFKDVNGPRGGVDTLCRIKVVLSRLPSVIVEELAASPAEAFGHAADRVERTVRRDLGRARAVGTVGRVRAPRSRAKAELWALPPGVQVAESLIGRREGRSPERLMKAADRPEKRRRDYYVDTSLPGVSASDRKAGGFSTAARNTKLRTRKATATLEDSLQGRPTRKSTRKSSNRAKQGSKLSRRQTRRVTSPQAKASRNAAR